MAGCTTESVTPSAAPNANGITPSDEPSDPVQPPDESGESDERVVTYVATSNVTFAVGSPCLGLPCTTTAIETEAASITLGDGNITQAAIVMTTQAAFETPWRVSLFDANLVYLWGAEMPSAERIEIPADLLKPGRRYHFVPQAGSTSIHYDEELTLTLTATQSGSVGTTQSASAPNVQR